MRSWLSLATLLGFLSVTVLANEVQLKDDEDNRQRCSGMYSRKSWGGKVDPYILVKFLGDRTPDGTDPLASLVVFEWKDEPLLGRYPPSTDAEDPLAQKSYICDPAAVSLNYCKEEDIGAFILEPNATDTSKNQILNTAIHLKDPKAHQYPIKKTGYYCVTTYPYSSHEYNAVVEFRNSYGELPAAQIAKLPFYGGLAITYALLFVFWAFLYVQNRQDVLAVQNYITVTLIFLIVEQLMTWGYYDYQNTHGNNGLNKAFMIIVSILNAGRNSLSFFLLLIVCMGYGVVKTSLGKSMWYVRALAATHFLFGVIYAVASLSVTPDSAGPLLLLVIMPLAATLTAFYVWTLSSLNMTMKDLADRKQRTKFMMYRRLWYCIIGSILIIFAFFFINSFQFAGTYQDSANYIPEHWQTRWFVLDGWLNIVYFFDIAFISYLWRPTANNRRFAMSDEIAQDEEGTFEFRSIGGISDDEDEDETPEERAQRKLHENAVQPSGNVSTSIADSGPALARRLSSPSRQSKPLKPPPQNRDRLRESMEGETIFAVGEGDWSDGSDDEDDRAEHGKLTRKI